MSDLIERQAAIDIVSGYAEQLNGYIGSPNDSEVYAYARGLILSIERNINAVRPVQPTYTDTEIQKMQDMEQAQLDKAFELGREDAQAEIIRCKDCKFAINVGTTDMMCKNSRSWVVATDNSFGCVLAERGSE